MRIEKMLVFEDTEAQDQKFILDWLDTARNFFTDEGSRAVEIVVAARNVRVTHGQLMAAWHAVTAALMELDKRTPHQAFPLELKQQYRENLLECLVKLVVWIRKVRPEGETA